MTNIGWKFMAIYCGWLGIEFIVVFLLYPETHGRTLEELAFCKYLLPASIIFNANVLVAVFEDKELADKAVEAVEKEIHVDHVDSP
jgi:hypothetical protein